MVSQVATDRSWRQAKGKSRVAWEAGFRKLWAAQTVALFGAEIATLAIPLLAALTLRASALQMGLLLAAGQAPFLLCSLPLGVFVDRVRRRPLLIAADIGRALLLTAIPIASLCGLLSFGLLCFVAFLTGCLAIVFDVAHYAYVPSVVPRANLTAANGRLQVSYSAAESTGPGLAGLLIQAVSAAMATFATAAAFLASALLLTSIRGHDEPVRHETPSPPFREAVAEGLGFLLKHPLLRPIIAVSAAASLFAYGVRAIYVIFATQELAVDAAQLGLIFAVGGVAAVPGGLLAGKIAGRFGLGMTIWCGWFVEGLALLLVPMASGGSAIALLIAAQAIGGLANTISNVNQWSLRQVVTPDHLQGRVTASHRFLVYGAYPLGAVLGGVLATGFGVRAALVICAAGAVIAPFWLFATPVRARRAMPTGPDADVAGEVN